MRTEHRQTLSRGSTLLLACTTTAIGIHMVGMMGMMWFPTTAGRINHLPFQPSLDVSGTEILLEANVIVREFTHFVVINSDDLRLFRAAETEARNEVHDPENNGRHHERIAKAGAGVSKLPPQLRPVSVEPTALDNGQTVKACNRLLCEDPCEHLRQAGDEFQY